MGILQYKGEFTFQDQEWNKTSVDKIKELRQVALMAFKSQEQMTEMPGKVTSEDAFTEWTTKMHRPLKLILRLREVCSDTYTIFKIQHPNHGDGVCDYKCEWRHATDAKRNVDAKRIADAKRDTDATQSSPEQKAEKQLTKKLRQRQRSQSLTKQRIRKESNGNSKYTWVKGEGGE